MRLWRTVGILVFVVVASGIAIWTLDHFWRDQFREQRNEDELVEADNVEKIRSFNAPLEPVTERIHFEHRLRVRTEAGEEITLDFREGKHIVVFAGCY